MTQPTAIVVGPAASEDIEAVRRLFRQYAASVPFDLAYQNFEAELEALPAPYAPPKGSLLVAKDGPDCLGTVGLKRLDTGIGEIKRLFVAPAQRARGIGKLLLARIINEARRRGYESIRLDSHRATMTAAIALYRTHGFVEIPPYGPDLDGQIVFFEKLLRA
jgi:putative acetyltransferase